MLGVAAVALDRRRDSRVDLWRTAPPSSFDDLVIATGAVGAAIALGADRPASTCCARSTMPSGCATQLDGGQSLLVVGAGFIGSEIASAARERGMT